MPSSMGRSRMLTAFLAFFLLMLMARRNAAGGPQGLRASSVPLVTGSRAKFLETFEDAETLKDDVKAINKLVHKELAVGSEAIMLVLDDRPGNLVKTYSVRGGKPQLIASPELKIDSKGRRVHEDVAENDPTFCVGCKLMCQPGRFGAAEGGTLDSRESCTQCPLGKFQDEAGAASCRLCPAGTFGERHSAVSAKEGCSPDQCDGACGSGRYGRGGSSNDRCDGPCPAGRYGLGGSFNELCDGKCMPGQWSRVGSSVCLPKGSFKTETGKGFENHAPQLRVRAVIVGELVSSFVDKKKIAFGLALAAALRVPSANVSVVMPCSAKSTIALTPACHTPAALTGMSVRGFCTSGDVFEMVVPVMGESVSEGAIEEWLKGVGDYVHQDEVVCSIETDKVSVEVRAEGSGAIVALLVEEGDTVAVGAPLLQIDRAAEAPAAAAETAAAPPAEAAPAAAEAA
eukprot:g3121.t1